MFAMHEVLLAIIYFNEVPATRSETDNVIAQVSMHLARNPDEATFTKFDDMLTCKSFSAICYST